MNSLMLKLIPPWGLPIPADFISAIVITSYSIHYTKLYDIVWVMTGGRDDTQVIAQQMVQEFFTNRDNGVGATLAVVLFIAVTPILLLNIKRFRAQEEMR